MEEELVKMSSKGQLVVPRNIRKRERLKPTDRFIAVAVKGGVLFKRINIPNVKLDFESLSKEISEHFKKEGVNRKDVRKAVEWARG